MYEQAPLLIAGTSGCDHICKRGPHTSNQVKTRSFGWPLIQLIFYKKGITDTDTQAYRENIVKMKAKIGVMD